MLRYLKEHRIAKRKTITIWNILALIVVVTGIPLTILQARAALQDWAQSGKRFPLGVWDVVDLKETNTLVYYESSDAIPTEYITLTFMDLDGNSLTAATAKDRNDFSYNDKQGAALFELSLPRPGSYRFICNDAMANSIADNPKQDEIVFAKSPNSKAQAQSKSTLTYIIGGGSTLLLAAILYIVHGICLQRADRPSKTSTPASFAANIGVPDE